MILEQIQSEYQPFTHVWASGRKHTLLSGIKIKVYSLIVYSRSCFHNFTLKDYLYLIYISAVGRLATVFEYFTFCLRSPGFLVLKLRSSTHNNLLEVSP